MPGQARCAALFVILLGGCTVGSLPLQGRRCDEQHGCGGGLLCDPVTKTCQLAVDLMLRDAVHDSDSSVLDQQADAGIDLAIDAALPRKMVCEAAVLVGSGADSVAISTPALRTDGLTLVGKSYGSTTGHSTTRQDVASPFGQWQPFELPTNRSDPYYFEWGGLERLIMTTSGDRPRQLWLCSPTDATAACETVEVLDETGAKIAHDMDGPSVIQLGSSLLMAFNIQPGETADVFLAQPQNAADLSVWVASPAGASNIADVHEDDPALSPDGKLLVFERAKEGSNLPDNDLWVAYRSDTTSGFSVAEPLAGVNTSASDGSPSLYGFVDETLELFFSSDRMVAEQPRVYRSVCRLE